MRTVKKNVTAKINTNIVPEVPKDLRRKFLSVQNYNLLVSVSRFAADYARGRLRLNNLALMGYDNSNRVENIKVTKCQGSCNLFFGPSCKILHCVIDLDVDLDDASVREKKFLMMCNNCASDYKGDDRYDVLQLFPHLKLVNVERLCELGFLTKYIFPINLDYKIVKRQVPARNYHDIYAMVKSIIAEKKTNEQISEINLRTYGRTLFTDTDFDCTIKSTFQDNPDVPSAEFEFYPVESSMLKVVKTFDDRTLRDYFYEVTTRVYDTRADYVLYYNIMCKIFCTFCTETKLYDKIHPVLYCTKCGFTDAFYFRNSNIINGIKYYKQCVVEKTKNSKCIRYYDLDLYKKLLKNNKK
nr:me53 [Mamestra configurata nucleopolyhedrovirus A]